MRLRRHELLNQREDLDKFIFHLTEGILLPPHSWLEIGPMILYVLFTLAQSLALLSEMSNQPEDAIYAAKYFRHLRDQPHAAFGLPRHQVTALLVDMLAFQVGLEASNVAHCLEEMAILCNELLTLDASDVTTTASITCFARAVASKVSPLASDLPFNRVIECLRLARKHRPDLREARYALALSLFSRYCMTYVNDDYEEAASILDEIITSSSARDGRDELVAITQVLVTKLAFLRSIAHETPEYSEEAMYRARAYPGSSSDIREINAKERFRYFRSIDGIEASSGNSPLSPPAPVASFEKHYEDPRIGPMIEKTDLLKGLLSRIRNNDITEIDEAIEKGRTVLASAPKNMLT